MDEIVIQPGRRTGKVEIPCSKSHLHRVLIAAFLSGKKNFPDALSGSEDVGATRRCLDSLSAFAGIPTLDCGESGSTLRFLLPVAMSVRNEVIFTGTGRLPQRPVAPFLELMQQHGVSYHDSSFPLHLKGGLMPGTFTLPGNISSQIITGLLFALPTLSQDSWIELTSPLESKGYVAMTLDVLCRFGILAVEESKGYRIPGKQQYRCPGAISVEKDWSSAAFWIVMNHLGSRIQMEGMNDHSFQPDRAIGSLLCLLGGEINVSQCPDIFPVLSIAAAAHDGKTVFTGVERLRLKESDRLSAMEKVLYLFGVKTDIEYNRFVVHGIGPHFCGNVSIPTFGDHRIAMAAAVGATLASAPVIIQNPECVKKSYPDFFCQLQYLTTLCSPAR